MEQYDLETGVTVATYRSGRECAEANGIHRNVVSMCCYGRQTGVNNMGFRFVGSDAAQSRDGDDRDQDSLTRKGSHKKSVEQFSLETGETIQVFPSSTLAANSLGVQKSKISLCLSGQEDGIGEFGFRYLDSADRGKKSSSVGAKKKPVEQFNVVTGEVIATFPSGKDAAIELGLNRTVVSLCCIGRQKCVGEDFGFRFADPAERQRAESSHVFRKSYIRSRQHFIGKIRSVEVFDVASNESIQVF